MTGGSIVENILVGLIVVVALAWAIIAAVRGMRQGRAPGSKCACTVNCPIASECPTDTPGAPGALCNEDPVAVPSAAAPESNAAQERP